MKKDLWLVMVFLAAFLLGACALNLPTGETESVPETTSLPTTEATAPPETEPQLTEQEKAIAQCRAVLNTVQSGTNYKITMTRWYEGVWDTTLQTTYYRSGNDRAMVGRNSTDDHDGEFVTWSGSSIRVSVDGNLYYGYAMPGDPYVWEGPLTDEALTFDPWMYTFDWDAQKVELQEIRKTAEGRCITFKVDGTYPEDRVLSDYYTISFYFDEAGNFLERELVATGVEQTFLITEDGLVASGEPVEGSGNITRVDHVTVDSLDPYTCHKEIKALYQEALN